MVQKVHFPASKVRQSLEMSTPLRRRSSGFIIVLGEDPLLLEGELLFGDVAQVFLESRVRSEKQRELASCHGNA